MWLYCPRCNAHTNAKNRSLYGVFQCGTCNHRFRGIQAKPNKLWHGLVVIVNPGVGSLTVTWCPHCFSSVHGESGETQVVHTLSPPQPDWDGCGPCTSCGFIFQMMFNNAVCPKCSKTMSWEDAFFSCGSYPHSTPPENQ